MFKWFIIALRNVIRNKRRSFGAVLTISVGISALILSYGYINYSFWGLSRTIVQGGMGNAQIADKRIYSDVEDSLLQFGIDGGQADAITVALNAKKIVKRTMKRVSFSGVISSDIVSTIFIGTGIEPVLEERLRGGFSGGYTKGRALKSKNLYDVVLAKGLARKLKVDLGDSVTILSSTIDGGMNGMDFTVAGFYDTGVPMRNNLELKINLLTAGEILLTDKVSRIVVQLKDFDASISSLPELTNTVASVNNTDTLIVKSWYTLAPFFRAVEYLYNNIFSILGSIIVLVVLLSVSGVMQATVLERIPEIGTLKAFGMPNKYLYITFVSEGFIISVLGSILGIIISMAVVVFVNTQDFMMPPPPGRTNGYPLALLPTLPSVGISTLIMICIGMLSAFLPLSKTLKKSVVEQINNV